MTVGMLAAGLLVGVLSPAVASATPSPASSSPASSSSKPTSLPEGDSKIQSAKSAIQQGIIAHSGNVSVSDMADVQKRMNRLADLSEQETAVVSGTGSGSVRQMAKNLKDNS